VGEAWERARDTTGPYDAHTAGCPYCLGAAEGLAALDTAARALRTDRPGGRTVADRVMRAVRAEGRLGRLLPLDDPDQGLRIAETAAAAVFRRAADTVPGVRAAGCRLLPDGEGSRRVDITMTLAVSLDAPLLQRAAAVRRMVARAARQYIGIAPGRIDVRIASVLETDAAPVSSAASASATSLPSHRDGGTP
jgi:hypothetical protein